jgi:hypothetical protein
MWGEETSEDIRIAALEILIWTPPTNESTAPPPVALIEPEPIVVDASDPDRAAPAGASLPPFGSDVAPITRLPSPARVPVIDVTPEPPPPEEKHALVLPVFRPGASEIVESLSLPDGLTEDMLAEGAVPTTPSQARIAMTRQARALGRDYRMWYGTTLKTNAVAIEFMQRHLRRRFGDTKQGERAAKKLETELTRHGALLSEILARSLGGRWTDVSGEQPGHWSMVVPPSLRVWPIGRVYRFFRQGHREEDLVAFYLELEAKSQRGMK